MKTSWKLVLFMLLSAVFRFVYAGLTELTPDEAYYWEWSRRLQLSYYDHPPMVAYLIFLSTSLGGAHTETWVRFQGVVLGAGISLVAYLFGRDMFNSERVGLYSALYVNMVLLVSVGCFIITPDTPQGFFGALTLYCFYKSLRTEKTSWWVFSGISLGLAMLSKYTGLLLAPCILLTLLTRPEYRKWFFRKELYIAAGTAFLMGLQVLVWNYQQDWASISLQSRHGFFGLGVNPFKGFFDFLGTQFGLLTPFVFIGVVSVMAYSFARRKDDPRHHFIFWNSAPILIFFCVLSFRQKIEGNWAALAYFVPLVGSVGVYTELKEAGLVGAGGKWVNFLKWSSLATSIGILGFVYVHAVTPLVSLKKSLDVTRRLHGWRELARGVDEVRVEMGSKDTAPFVFGNRHQIISELTFYLDGRPQTYKVGGRQRYSHLRNVERLLGMDAVYVAEKVRSNPDAIRKHFQRMETARTVTIKRAGRIIWEFVIIKCYHYQGGLVNV